MAAANECGDNIQLEPRPEAMGDLGARLVISLAERGQERRVRLADRQRQVLVRDPAKDVVVWTPDEIAAWAGVSNHFITTILREGRVLYAR